MTVRHSIFVSYSHADRLWLDRLTVHLRPLHRHNRVDIWDDSRIAPGALWKEEIAQAINSAKVAILLVSANFFASDFIAENELPPLLEAANSDGATILPLIISPSRFADSPELSRFQAVNDPAQPLMGLSAYEQEQIFVRLARAVERLCGPPFRTSREIAAVPRTLAQPTNLVGFQPAVIKVVGVGGGGGNSVQHIVDGGLGGVEFISVNSDAQALSRLTGHTKLRLGSADYKGLGAGGDPRIGQLRAFESELRLRDLLSGADLLFLTAGMGGGTGTGAAPVIAGIAKELGILTIAVVTKPFFFEGQRRMAKAMDGIDRLIDCVDSIIVIPNDKLFAVVNSKETLLEGFKRVNEVLRGVVQGIVELLTQPGLVNVDFADMRTVMAERGYAKMGQGRARGVQRAKTAAEAALNNPLTEDLAPTATQGVLVNVSGGPDLLMEDLLAAGTEIEQHFSTDTTIIMGTSIDPSLDGELRITVVSTGFRKVVDSRDTTTRATSD